jgi:phosphoserine aminotransferase
MSDRFLNFGAGPATLPLPVLEQARRELLSIPGVGVSPLEVSHRSPWFEDVIGEAEANLRELIAIPPTHHVAFCPGGATMQFSMVAMNLLRGSGATAEYVVTGAWGEKALERRGKRAPSGSSGRGADLVSSASRSSRRSRRCWSPAPPTCTSRRTRRSRGSSSPPTRSGRAAMLVCDASSDFLSRPIDIAPYGVLYAGAQKNAGPAGVAVAIVRDDVLARIPHGLPTMLDYRTYVESGSLYNTPPVFSIYVLMLVTRWLLDEVGGLEAQLACNREKAGLLYEAIDASHGFYRGHAEPGSRSLTNVTWRLPTEELDRRFVAEAGAAGMIELKGHRSAGGVRASLYNAMSVDGAHVLADFMRRFEDAERVADPD